MKRILIIVIAGFFAASCNDNKAQEKVLLNEVIKVHEKVMAADERLIKNKIKLDTLLNKKNFPTDTAKMLNNKLVTAENAMESWMHSFNPEQTKKTHSEILTYLGDQKKKIVSINLQMNAAISQSDKYLLKAKAK